MFFQSGWLTEMFPKSFVRELCRLSKVFYKEYIKQIYNLNKVTTYKLNQVGNIIFQILLLNGSRIC